MQYLLQNKWKLYLSLPQLNSNILHDTNYKSKCHLTNLKIFLNQSEFSQDHVEDLSPPLRFNLSPLLRFPPWICPNIQVFPRFRRMRGYHKTIKIVVKSEVKKHGFSFQKLGITKKLSPLNKQKIKFKFSWTHKKNATDLFLPIVVLSIFHLMKGSLKSEDTVAVKTMSLFDDHPDLLWRFVDDYSNLEIICVHITNGKYANLLFLYFNGDELTRTL